MALPTNEEFEAKAAEKLRSGRATKEQVQEARLSLERDRFAANISASRDQYPGVSGALGSAVSAGMNFGNEAIPNIAATGAAALTSPITALRRGIGLGDAYGVNRERTKMILGASPVAAAAGQIAASVTPTPMGLAYGKAFEFAKGVKLAKMAAESAKVGAPVRAAAQQLLGQLTGSAGAIAAGNTVHAILGDREMSQIVTDTVEQATSGTNIGMAVAITGLSAAFRSAPPLQTMALFEKMKRYIPDFRATPDMLRDERGFVPLVINALANSTKGASKLTSYLRNMVYDPMNKAMDDIANSVSPGTRAESTEKAAKAIRELLPSAEGTPRNRMGAIGRRISDLGDSSFAESAQRGEVVPQDQLRVIHDALGRLDKAELAARGSLEPRGSDLGGVIDRFRAMYKRVVNGGESVTPQHIENLRQSLAPLAGFSETGMPQVLNQVVSARDAREARRLYAVMRLVEKRSSPVIDNALTEIASLRRMAATFKPIAKTADSENSVRLVQEMFASRNFLRRWANFEQLARPDAAQAARGAYLGEFMERVVELRGKRISPDRLLRADRMRVLFDGAGPFNRATFERVLGRGVSGELQDLAHFSDAVARSIGRIEGSPTAGRQEAMGTLVDMVEMVGDLPYVATTPGLGTRLIGKALGIKGMFVLASSIIDGRAARALNKLATGQHVTGNRGLPAALAQQGGASNLAPLAVQGLATAANTAGSALGGISAGISQ